MQLEFSINKQIITRTDENTVVAGSKNYLYAHFTFCEDWLGVEKTAVFKRADVFSKEEGKAYTVLLENDTCRVPHEVIKEPMFTVSVFGGERITANKVEIPVILSGYEEGETPEEPTPTVYEQLLDKAERMEQLAHDVVEGESARARAEEERQQTFEELNGEFESLADRMRDGLTDFENEAQSALDNFQTDTSTALSGFDVEKRQALDHFTEQSEAELEKVQTATENAEDVVNEFEVIVEELVYPMYEKVENLTNVYQFRGSVDTFDDLPYSYKLKQAGDITNGNKLIATFDEETGINTFTDDYYDVDYEIRYSFVWTVPIEKITLKGGLYYHPLEDFGDFEYNPCGYTVRNRLPQLEENATVVDGLYYLENDIEIDTIELYYDYIGWTTFSIEEFIFDFNIVGVKTPDAQTVYSVIGDVYNVLDTDMNYAWTGADWDSLGGEHKDLEAREQIDELKAVTEAQENKISELQADVSTIPNTYANAIKGTASGEVIGITDISPIEHNLGVKLSSKNLFNNDTSLVVMQTAYNSNGTEYKRYGYAPIELPEGTYTVSANLIGEQTEEVYLYYSILNSSNTRIKIGNIVAGNAITNATFTINSGEKFFICNGSGTDTLAKTKKHFGWFDIQLEKGTKATPYTPFVEDVSTVKLTVEESGAIYTPNADGTVEGVKSIYPNMTLMTDKQGVLVECEYNKDTNKVIENLVNAIISLGGKL
jgi:hypothetical protein